MSVSFSEAVSTVCAPGSMFELVDGEVGGVPMKLFAATPPSLRSLFDLAALRGAEEFLIYEDEVWSVDQVLAKAGQIGDLLRNELGVANGDRVALAMRNYPEWICAFVAITSIGAVAVPLNAWWTTPELIFGLSDSGSNVCLVDEVRMDLLAEASQSMNLTLVAVRARKELPSGVIALEESLNPQATMPAVDIEPDDIVTILYTSGTTGKPKGAVSSHRALLSALLGFGARAAVGALTDPPPVVETAAGTASPPSATYILAVPLFHVTGLVPVMLGSFVGGSRLVMMRRWDPERALELIERERVSHFVGVPTMVFDLLESPSFANHDTSSLRAVGGGGAPMPAALVERIDQAFPQGSPGLGYGMTETNAYGPQIGGKDFLANPTSTGRCIPIVQIQVVDSRGVALSKGEIGEICFRGPNLISGYWHRPEATAETIVDGWLRTGDIGYVDDEGFVYLVDRAKDMVLRAGENVYCAEVESAIYEHPAVHEAAVYGVADERLGERVGASIMAKPGQSLGQREIVDHLTPLLARFKVPTDIVIVSEPLPRNAAGKILKRELKAQAEGGAQS